MTNPQGKTLQNDTDPSSVDDEQFPACIDMRLEYLQAGTVVGYLEGLPRDVGWLLITAGIVAEVAPGVIGTPFWVAGTLILWPRMGRRVEGWMLRRSPRLLYGSIRQIDRFLGDLERRYPRASED